MGTRFRDALKWLAFGSARFPQQCAIGLREPQQEVSVWLHGLGAALEVTGRNVVVAARPLTIGIGLSGHWEAATGTQPVLKFRQRQGENRLLGEIGLRLTEVIPLGSESLCVFETGDCRNYCLPRARLWARDLHYSWQRWRSGKRSDAYGVRMTARELRCLFIFYICPRPVVLVTVTDGNLTNIFPMDLIGPVATRYFALALHGTSAGAPLMERSRSIALSSVPVDTMSVAYDLGKNRKRPHIDCDSLPFATRRSAAFGLPVPEFSLRVRELEIETVRSMGSHKLFLAKTIEDQCRADGLQLFLIHGFYQAWRHRAHLQGTARG